MLKSGEEAGNEAYVNTVYWENFRMMQTFAVFADGPTTVKIKNRECLNGRNDDIMWWHVHVHGPLQQRGSTVLKGSHVHVSLSSTTAL